MEGRKSSTRKPLPPGPSDKLSPRGLGEWVWAAPAGPERHWRKRRGPSAGDGLGNRGAIRAGPLCRDREHGGTQAVSRRIGSPREPGARGRGCCLRKQNSQGGVGNRGRARGDGPGAGGTWFAGGRGPAAAGLDVSNVQGPTSKVHNGEEGVPSEAGTIWLASAGVPPPERSAGGGGPHQRTTTPQHA